MEKTALASSIWKSKWGKMKFTWYPGDNLEKFKPYNQVYGVVFNSDGKILIQRIGGSAWCLAGGTVEAGETAVQTLRRELIEEADVTIKNPILLGGQKVESTGKDDFYQLRYYCEVDRVLPQTPDPDNDKIHDRLFVDPSEITNYFDWGATGQAIFDQATTLFHHLHP